MENKEECELIEQVSELKALSNKRILVVGDSPSSIEAMSLLNRMASVSVVGVEKEFEENEFKIKMTPKFEFDDYIPKRVDKRVSDNHFLSEMKKMRKKGKR